MDKYATASRMKTRVFFESGSFPYVPDECVNPHLYGENLATFVAGQLPAYGYEVLDCYAEDVGWEIAIANEAFPLFVRCSNMGEGDNWFGA